MNLYPALSAAMGQWRYYIVKMKMREVASEVRFATEVYEDRTLDEAIQRELKEGRVRKEIVSFLSRRPDRFFASLVVSAIGGNPKFYPVHITGDPQFALFSDQGLDQAFGVLTFSGEQKYYALDGQHRLKAIKTLLDRTDPLSAACPATFPDEEISVLVIVKRDEPETAFLEAYRRLFSSLNRYAKPTDRDTNIIMDEDDAFAILTRRLISEHEFFKWTGGRGHESAKVKTRGKNLSATDSYFTSLQTLYDVNERLLRAAWREQSGWGTGDTRERDIDLFRRFRPEEEFLDQLFIELVNCWNGILLTFPELRENPVLHRVHNPAEEGQRDTVMFWPIGQELFARLVRVLLDVRFPVPDASPSETEVHEALQPMRKLSWDLHDLPWRHLLLINDDDEWKMRNEERKAAMDLCFVLGRWLLGLDEYSADELAGIKKKWQQLLLPRLSEADADAAWNEMLSVQAAPSL
jgi:DGQHR domain-containing protein